MRPVPVVLRARHVRLQQTHVEALFGAGYRLTPIATLPIVGSQVCAETVVVRANTSARIEAVRVLAPAPKNTRVHVSPRDLVRLGIDPALAQCQLAGSPGCTLEGPKGTVVLAEGVLTPKRTLLLPQAEASALGLVDGQTVHMDLTGDRPHRVGDVRVVLAVPADDVRALVLDLDDPLAADVNRSATATLGA
jgi:propanediol utilization protein